MNKLILVVYYIGYRPPLSKTYICIENGLPAPIRPKQLQGIKSCGINPLIPLLL
jgi:hypothetical protein